MRKLGLAALGLLLGSAALAAPDITQALRNSRFFQVNVEQKRIGGSTSYVQPALSLDLSSLATDQPQYWPNEKVYGKVMALSRGGQTLTGAWHKRDAAPHKIEVKLNRDGVAVFELMDGGKQRLELGEYRVELTSSDKKTTISSTFTVVDGALGAVSFAHEWKRVTTIDALEKSWGAWFLGNAGGAGQRWGNGLSFKNELRAANQPYRGHATINSRCMLPGCNGTFAGKTMEAEVKDGHISGTLDVGGHSGPFQIEVVTAQGSLRHQFEGSSHVEREMLVVAGGMGWSHKVGLAPYEGTTQIPGRQLYLESKAEGGAGFELRSVVADKGQVQLGIKQPVANAKLVVWNPQPDGSYAPKELPQKSTLAAGASLSIPVTAPYSLVTIGGFVGGKFVEGWAMVFTPGQLEVQVAAPGSGAPNKPVSVTVSIAGGGRVSGILEVFDNRVASKSSASGLGSALGDSVRATSNAVSSWRDNTGISPESREKNKRRPHDGLEEAADEKEADAPSSISRGPSRSMAVAPSAPPPPGGQQMPSPTGGKPQERTAPKEIIREGEKKVVFCQLVETGADGKAAVTVTLPPQTGRVVARFVAARGLDHGEGQAPIDVKLGAYADARLPRVIVPGAELALQIDVTNNLPGKVNLLVEGAGIERPLRKQIAQGSSKEEVRLVARQSGTIVVQLSDANGKPIDRRELPVNLLGDQQVTYSRLEFGGGQGAIQVGADEEVVVFEGAGPLLRGVVMNMFTTTESWFGHAEALSARVAVQAVLLASIDRGLLSDEGLGEQLRSGLNLGVRSLAEKFCDQGGLCRPYPGLPASPLWSAWTSRNLHAAMRALGSVTSKDQRVVEAGTLATQLAARIDAALVAQRYSLEEQAGLDAQGNAVIPIEMNGHVVYRVLTDDAVSRWAMEKLLPALDWEAASGELAFSKAYDRFRFLKAFERTGSLQYLTEVATALYRKGERQEFARLYRLITRGMILTQEPGLLQGPALLGGVYSTPMAMVKFLELQLVMREGQAKERAKLAGKSLAYGERAKGGGRLELPAGAIARVDKKGRVRFDESKGPAWAVAQLSSKQGKVGQELGLEVTLDKQLDPAEYYALIAVPSTVAVKQTEDILADYRGQLIYGQQATGGTRMQLVAVPFRGSRAMRLVLEGAYPGQSVGKIAIRHIEKADGYDVRGIGAITIR